MIRVTYSSRFWKQAAQLPLTQQKRLASLLLVVQENPFDSRLHTKRLQPPLAGSLSFRITRDWRVQFHFLDTETILCVTVKHRKDIYR